MYPKLSILTTHYAVLFFSCAGLALLISGLWFAGDLLATGSASGSTGWGTEHVTHVLLIVGGLVPLFVVSWFLYLFGGTTISAGKIGRVIVFCYLTTGLMLLGSLLPFVAFPLAPSLQQLMIASPVGVTPGCKTAGDHGSVLKELACGAHTDQWIVNIGGVVESAPGPAATSGPANAAGGQSLADGVPSVGLKDRKWATVEVRGGLVVPLYFVILALMGAAISMTRGVPRCQQRLIPGQPDSITPEEAREYLVLQIMQVFSAPLIAIVSYHIFEPESARTSVILGFACGFASETILLFISAAIRKLNPDGPLPAQSRITAQANGGRAVAAVSASPADVPAGPFAASGHVRASRSEPMTRDGPDEARQTDAGSYSGRHNAGTTGPAA
ncbi:hypothetical protein PQQ64_19770 [Paraburkholderia graminis]|uniref:hypothetical protein n=1 Tax=Paraburkholderia graminis TaxID=60548 RepID=UPI0038BD07EA